ncbi:uncharacterized protein LOC132038411 [Lycium ferocissimum]|uniref:uncharacterized protein LOC132038411 n=1 Tax=Lycium ferocissimum TaxID=112874 RepID=UPI002815C532|nr:uncharacterized protein LOC132038411 [Lycium ferocissimum]
MSVRVYVEQKKENRQFGMYPLCITTTDRTREYSLSGKIVIQGSLAIADTNGIQEMDANDSIALAASASSKEIVIFGGENDLIISNRNHKEVMVNQVYNDKETLKAVMTKYAIDNRFQFRNREVKFVSYTLACLSRQCEWKLNASSINRSAIFKIREFVEKHTCPLKDKAYTQHQASSGFIAGIIKPKFRNYKRKYVPSDIVDDVKNDFGVDVPYMKAWRAKEKAMTELRGEPAESYKKLPGYVYILDKTYPGSHIRMKKTSENEFLYLFVALYAFIKGFECCLPNVVVDGSHIKTAYNGTFVSASTMDGAGNILPLAYGVIDSENDKSWTWFFEQFKEAYGLRESMCVVYDSHESIIKAVSNVYPNVPHFACIWHLWKNVYNKYKKSHKVLSGVYYAMAKAYTQDEFDMLMEMVAAVDIRVKDYTGVDMLDTIGVLVQMSLEESSWCFRSKSCFLMFFNIGPNQLQRYNFVWVYLTYADYRYNYV